MFFSGLFEALAKKYWPKLLKADRKYRTKVIGYLSFFIRDLRKAAFPSPGEEPDPDLAELVQHLVAPRNHTQNLR